MSKFHSLRVKNIKKETNDCVSVGFEVADTDKTMFEFTQGQYLTLRSNINGKEVRRSYSICSAVGEDLRVAIKKIDGGLFSTFANDVLKNGDSIEAMPPMGRFFTNINPSQSKYYVGFASGSGITPIFSILKTVLQNEPQSNFTLFYGNKNAKSVIFREQIEGLKNKYLNRLRVFHILSREFQEAPIFNGRLSAEKCEVFCEHLLDVKSIDEVFLCGPEEMILGVRDTFLAKGIDAKKIHFELFTTGAALQKNTKKEAQSTDNEILSQVTIKLDGKLISFPLAQNGINILDEAMEQGADLPYACKGGVCCTCKCKLLEGKVHMSINYGLEADEIEEGFVLSCQAHPRSENVVLDFDV